jgi:uracil-DNA glycosylase
MTSSAQSTFDFGCASAQPVALNLRAWPPDVQALAADWRALWSAFAASAAGQALFQRVAARLAAGAPIYPPQPLRMWAQLPLADVRVVILGQDPYHGPGQAEGLAFSVPEGVKIPPSLRNIFKEIHRDLQTPLPASGHLGHWVAQGALLLNTVLTVEEGLPASHAQWGWEKWTDRVITALAQREQPLVFMLWGAHAQAKLALIRGADPGARHRVLQANHPSPLSALRWPTPFMGCGHFSAANAFLRENGQPPIDW